MGSTLIAGLLYPVTAAALCGTWVFARILYTIGYSTGDPEKVGSKRCPFRLIDSDADFDHSATSAVLALLVVYPAPVSHVTHP